MKKSELKTLLARSKNQNDMFPAIPSKLQEPFKPKWRHKKGDVLPHICDNCHAKQSCTVVRTYGDMMKLECNLCSDGIVVRRETSE